MRSPLPPRLKTALKSAFEQAVAADLEALALGDEIFPAAKMYWEGDRFRCLTFDELLDDEADFSTYLDWLEGEIQTRKIAEQ